MSKWHASGSHGKSKDREGRQNCRKKSCAVIPLYEVPGLAGCVLSWHLVIPNILEDDLKAAVKISVCKQTDLQAVPFLAPYGSQYLQLQEEELKDAVILVYANKQDLPGALDDAAVSEGLSLHMIKNRQWAIFKTSAIKGEGLFEGLDW